MQRSGDNLAFFLSDTYNFDEVDNIKGSVTVVIHVNEFSDIVKQNYLIEAANDALVLGESELDGIKYFPGNILNKINMRFIAAKPSS